MVLSFVWISETRHPNYAIYNVQQRSYLFLKQLYFPRMRKGKQQDHLSNVVQHPNTYNRIVLLLMHTN